MTSIRTAFIALIFIPFLAHSESIKIDMGSYSWSNKEKPNSVKNTSKTASPKTPTERILNTYESSMKEIVSEYKDSIKKTPKKLNYKCNPKNIRISTKFGDAFISGYINKSNYAIQLEVKVIKNELYGNYDILDSKSVLVINPNGRFDVHMDITESKLRHAKLSFVCSDY